MGSYETRIPDRPVAVHSRSKRGGVVALHNNLAILRHVHEVVGEGCCPVGVAASGRLEVGDVDE